MAENQCVNIHFRKLKKEWKLNSKKIKGSNKIKAWKNEIENKSTMAKMNQTKSQLFEMTSIFYTFLKNKSDRQAHWGEKWAKDFNRYFTKEAIQMIPKHKLTSSQQSKLK